MRLTKQTSSLPTANRCNLEPRGFQRLMLSLELVLPLCAEAADQFTKFIIIMIKKTCTGPHLLSCSQSDSCTPPSPCPAPSSRHTGSCSAWTGPVWRDVSKCCAHLIYLSVNDLILRSCAHTRYPRNMSWGKCILCYMNTR